MKRSLLITLVALAVAVPAALASGGDGTRIALEPVKAFPAAKGSAKFKAKPSERELQVEVEHIRRLAGRRVVVVVGGAKLGTAKVSALGAARLSRNSELGQRVPQVSAGTVVKVRTGGGTTVVKGSF
jgi:predicted PilT family ATPase